MYRKKQKTNFDKEILDALGRHCCTVYGVQSLVHLKCVFDGDRWPLVRDITIVCIAEVIYPSDVLSI